MLFITKIRNCPGLPIGTLQRADCSYSAKALVFHFNHGSASVAAAISYIATVLSVMLFAQNIDVVEERVNDLYFTCHLGTAVCLGTYWFLGGRT